MSPFSKWRMTPRALFRILLALCLALAYAYTSRAQGIDTPESELASEGELVEGPSSEAIAATLASINAREPKDAIDWINAVLVLRRMGAYPEAQPFLNQAINANLDQRAKVDLHREIGTAELVRLSTDQALPEAREFVFSVFHAVRTARRDPAKLAQAVGELASDSEATLGAATRQLVSAGSYAVPAIVRALQGGGSQALDVAAIRTVLRRIGLDAEEPLLALLGAPDPVLQGFASHMLGPLGSKRASLHLMRPYFVGAADAQRGASNHYQRVGSHPPSVTAAANALLQRAEFHLQGNPPVRPDADGNVEIWTWDAEAYNVVPNVLSATSAGAVVAARFARDAYELQPSDKSARLLLVTRLQVDQSLGGLDELLPKGVGTAHQLGVEQGPARVRSALEYSLKHDHPAAAQGACEVMAQLCRGAVNSWDSLIPALQSSHRRVRFAAARAVMAIDPRSPYAGSSYLLQNLVDLADADGRPSVVVGMPRRDANDKLSGQMSSLGFKVQQVSAANQLLDAATKSSDLDMIVLSDSVSRPPARETIQKLRRHTYTANIPIVLMHRQNNEDEADRIAAIDDHTIVLPEFASDQALLEILDRAERMSRGVAVPPQQRLVQARNALSWLTHLAEYSQTYPWYDLQRAETVALKSISQPELSEQATTLLGYLGGELAQRQLVDLLGQKSLSVDERQRAANAFTEAVARRGLMLNGRDVLRQYDRYNASKKRTRVRSGSTRTSLRRD